MADGFDVHQQRGGKQAKESTLQDQCRAAVLRSTGIEKAQDLSKELNLPAPLLSFLTKRFGSDDFFINSDDVTAENISTETYNAICTFSKQSVVLKCIRRKIMEENMASIQQWTNKELNGIQKCLVSFNEAAKGIFVLQGDLKNLKKVVDDMTCKDKQADEGSLWDLLKKLASILLSLQAKNMHYRDLEVSKVCLDNSGAVWLCNPIIGANENANNDAFAVSETGASAIYTPPEVISGDQPTMKSNVWILGCILYEVAMQKPCYKTDGGDIFAALNDIVEGKKPENLYSGFSKELQEIIWSCLQVQAQERPNLETLISAANEQLKNKTGNLKRWLE